MDESMSMFASSADYWRDRAERAEQGWISVTERLPDYGVDVLLYRPDAPKSFDPTYIIRQRVVGYPGPFDFHCIAVPTHWMPLPNAPKEPQ